MTREELAKAMREAFKEAAEFHMHDSYVDLANASWLAAADVALATPTPEQREGIVDEIVVVEEIARASSRCLIIDVDKHSNASVYFEFDGGLEALRAFTGERVQVVVRKVKP